MTIDLSTSALTLARDAGLAPDDGVLPAPSLGHVPVRIVGLGWATVDLDRAAADLIPPDQVALAVEVRDGLLGARGRMILPGSPDGIRMVLLEPVAEGRLAGSLARRGEGPVALYVAAADRDLSTAIALLGTAGIKVRSGSTALGPGAIVLERSPAGPQVLLVAVPSEP